MSPSIVIDEEPLKTLQYSNHNVMKPFMKVPIESLQCVTEFISL